MVQQAPVKVSHSNTEISNNLGDVVCGQAKTITKLRIQAYFRRINMQSFFVYFLK